MGQICEICENPEPWSAVAFCVECGKDLCDYHVENHNDCTRINPYSIDHFNKMVKRR